MTTKHTPGPWKVTRRGVMALNPRTGRFSAVVCQPAWRGAEPEDVWLDTPREANAALIEVAPDLLAALKPLVCYSGPISFPEYQAACAAAIAAIAKAEGTK